jgi:hypothetical protein
MAGTSMIFIALPVAFLFGVLLCNAFTHPWQTLATFTRWSCWTGVTGTTEGHPALCRS